MPLCPENSYGLDVAFETGSISSDLYIAANLGLIDDAMMDKIMNEGHESQTHSFNGMMKGFDGMHEYLAQQVMALPEKEQFAVQFVAALNLDNDIGRMSEKVADLIVESRLYHAVHSGEISQEALEEAQERFFCPVTNRVLGRLGSGMGRFIEDQTSDLTPVLPEVYRDKDMTHPAVMNNMLVHPDLSQMHRSLSRLQDTLIAFGEDQDLRNISASLESIRSRHQATGLPDPSASAKHKLVTAKKQSIGKKILRRSMNVFKQIVGAKELKAFLTGDGIEVEGHYFNYRMRRNPEVDLVDNAYHPQGGHIPYKLTLMDKDSGLEMADICVYFEGTPAIDQVAAMIMHIQSGEEKAILEKANLFNVRPDFNRVINQLVTDEPEEDSVLSRIHRKVERGERGAASDLTRIANSHPGHRLYNEMIDPIRRAAKEHFKTRLGLEPWLMKLAEIGRENTDHERLVSSLSVQSAELPFESYTKNSLGIEFTRPQLLSNHNEPDLDSFGPNR